LGPADRQRVLELRLADDLAHRGLRDAFDHRLGFFDVEEVVDRIVGLLADLPLHVEVDVDDVLIAGQHQAFGQEGGRGFAAHVGAAADLRALDRGHLGLLDGADRRRHVPVETGTGDVLDLAEDHAYADLVRLHGVDTREQPAGDDEDRDDGDAASAADAPGHVALDAILAAAQQFLEVGRTLAGGAASPWPRTAAATPGAAAPSLILPRHLVRKLPTVKRISLDFPRGRARLIRQPVAMGNRPAS